MEKKLSIEGMSCQHCVGRVKKYLDTVGSNVKVDLEGKKAVFEADTTLNMETVIKDISAFGFTAREISS